MDSERSRFQDSTTGTDFPQIQNKLLWGDGPITLNVLEMYLNQRYKYLGISIPGDLSSPLTKRGAECATDFTNLSIFMDFNRKATKVWEIKSIISRAKSAQKPFESLLREFEEGSVPYERMKEAMLVIAKRAVDLVL